MRQIPGTGEVLGDSSENLNRGIGCHVNGRLYALMGERKKSEVQIEPAGFEEFFARSERPVRFALSARFGFEMGREATAEAMTYAWEHWQRVGVMDNPTGYVYRVGERIGRRMRSRRTPVDFARPNIDPASFEPKLAPALAGLSSRQRTCVVLVHALGWTHQETADFLGLSTSSVQKHVERGVARLRGALGVDVET